jgi:hypothetical protein
MLSWVQRGEAWRCGARGTFGNAYLFLVVQALVVVFKYGLAFCGAAVVVGGCVGDVTCEDFLPEGEAAGWAWRVGELVWFGMWDWDGFLV